MVDTPAAFSLVLLLFRSYGDGAAKRNAKINIINKSGIHETPHKIGPNGTIQYDPARPAKNKMTKNNNKGAYEPFRYPGANESEMSNAMINTAKIVIMLLF